MKLCNSFLLIVGFFFLFSFFLLSHTLSLLLCISLLFLFVGVSRLSVSEMPVCSDEEPRSAPDAPQQAQVTSRVHSELHERFTLAPSSLSTRCRANTSASVKDTAGGDTAVLLGGLSKAATLNTSSSSGGGEGRRRVPRRLQQLLWLLLLILLLCTLLGWVVIRRDSAASLRVASLSSVAPVHEAEEKGTATASVPPFDVPALPETNTTAAATATATATAAMEEVVLSSSPPRSTVSAAHTTSTTPATAPTPSVFAFPAVVPRRLPASWAEGNGGSVRVGRAFTVLTVAAGPPLTAPDDAPQAAQEEAEATKTRSQQHQLLYRAARGLCHSGLVRHESFHEWLVMHNAQVSGVAAGTAAAVLRETWTRSGCPSATAQGRSLVYVGGLPQVSAPRVHATTTAAGLLYGIRLVETSFVLLHDLHRVLITAPFEPHIQQHQQHRADVPAPTAEKEETRFPVLHDITLALQTLSRNDFPDLSHVVVDDTRLDAAAAAAADGADVHAFRLQLYMSAALRNAEREEDLQRQLIAYVKRVMQSSFAHDNNSTTTSTTTSAAPSAVAAAAAAVQDGLPVALYSASAHFHCQRAPLYNVRVVVPAWMRAAPHRRTTITTTTSTAANGNDVVNDVTENHDAPSPPPPALSTLCEVMLSHHSEMPAGYAVNSLSFHRSFCQEWLQFALLPSPVTPATEDAPANPLQGLIQPANRKNREEEADDTFAQRMDMAQSLADNICAAEWVAHLRAAQMWYAEQLERGQRHTPAATAAAIAHVDNGTAATLAARETRGGGERVLSNLAGVSPYLDQYAALLFSDDTAQLSRLAGTYLAFLPNASHALHHIRRTMTEKLRLVSLKHAAERDRRFKAQKEGKDHEVVCLPSHLSRVDLQSAMYDTQWLLSQLVVRCLQRRERCLGQLGEAEARVWLNMERYLSTTGKWSRGAYRVCLSRGVYISDPSSLLP